MDGRMVERGACLGRKAEKIGDISRNPFRSAGRQAKKSGRRHFSGRHLRGRSVVSLFDVVENKNNQHFRPSPFGAFFGA
jgi:hypothetical protein